MNETVSDGVFVSKKNHELYRRFTNADEAIFQTMKDMFMAAAVAAFEKGVQHDEPRSESVMVFRWAQFNDQNDVPLIQAITLATTGDVNDLIDQRKMLDCVQQFADAGVALIADKWQGTRDRTLQRLATDYLATAAAAADASA